MKKIINIVVLFATCGYLNAQSFDSTVNSEKKKKIESLMDMWLGIGYSTVSGGESSSGSSTSGTVGTQVGVGMNVYSFSKSFAINVGIVGSWQGAKYKSTYSSYNDSSYNTTTESTTSSLKLFYLGIPILARYQSNSGFYAEAGLQPAFLLSAKYKSGSTSMDYKSYLNSFDLGIPLGAGYRFSKHFMVGARIIPGITNINKKSAYTYSSNPSEHNLIALVRAGYTF